jgi:hypothetical protein
VSNAGQSCMGHDVRMNVKVSRRDFPLLTEAIECLPKGPRRTNRLAHLATLGLLWERAVAGSEAVPPQAFPGPPSLGTLPSSMPAQGYRSRLDTALLAALLDGDAAP